MKIGKTANYTGFLTFPEGGNEWKQAEGYAKAADTDLKNLFTMAHGRIRFGAATDGTMGENIAGEYQLFTSHADAGSEDTVAHSLGSIPMGYIVMKQDKNACLYAGSTTWTSDNIYFISSATQTAYTVFLVK